MANRLLAGFVGFTHPRDVLRHFAHAELTSQRVNQGSLVRTQKSDIAQSVGEGEVLFRANADGLRADLELGAKDRVCNG